MKEKINCSREEVTVRLHPEVLKWLDSFGHGIPGCLADRADVAKSAIMSAYNRHLVEAKAEELCIPISTAYALLSPFGFVNGLSVRQCFALLEQLASDPSKEVSSDE